MIDALVHALEAQPYSLPRAPREELLLSGLNELTARHYAACLPYRRIVDGAWSGTTRAERLADIPYLLVSLF